MEQEFTSLDRRFSIPAGQVHQRAHINKSALLYSLPSMTGIRPLNMEIPLTITLNTLNNCVKEFLHSTTYVSHARAKH